MNYRIHHFNSIEELQKTIDKEIKYLEDKIQLHSKIIGDKIRDGEENNSEELSDLKEKLNSKEPKDKKSDDKKPQNKKTSPKKKKGKKGDSENWIDYQNLHLYNGVGTRGELELYFKSLEGMKIDLERFEKTKESLSQLLKSGIKKDLAGIGYDQPDEPYQLAFIRSEEKREKFSFKSILTVRCE